MTDFPMEYVANIFILLILITSAVAMLCAKDLISASVKGGVFSLALVCEYMILAAPDVAITEAAVGAGMSTVLLLLAIFYADNDSSDKNISFTIPVIATGFLLGMMTAVFLSAPSIGSQDVPAMAGVASQYIASTAADTGIPNIVTAVLASYRGIDTYGEVIVVFCAAMIVYALLSVRDHANHTPQRDAGKLS